MTIHRGTTLLLALLLPGAFPWIASAAVITFVERGDSVFVQTDGGFDCGITSTVNGETAHVDACVNLGGPCANCSGSGDAFMVEPAGSPHPGAVSDRIHVTVFAPQGAQAFYTFDFISDDDNQPVYPPAGYPLLVENGQPQLLNSFFRDAPNGDGVPFPGNVEVWAQSDVIDEPTPVIRSTWSGIKARHR